MPASVQSFKKGNMFGMLRALFDANVPILTIAGAPTSGTSGSYVGLAGPGTILIDYTNADLYINTNTLASPTWTITNLDAISGDITIAAGVATLAPTLLRVASGTITSANITGTSAGQLGHANGVLLTAVAGTHNINQLVSAILINDFAVAAYTGGGNTTINIGGGGAALTGLVSNANFIQAAADKIIEFVPLAATFNVYTENNSLNLVTASAPTQPGTAAGVFRYNVVYRTIATGL